MKHLTHDFFSQPFRLSSMQFDRGITNRNGGWKERVHLLRKPHGIQVALCVSRRLKSFPISVLCYHAPANSPTRNPAGNPLPGLYSQSPFECVNLLDLFFTIFLFLFFFFLRKRFTMSWRELRVFSRTKETKKKGKRKWERHVFPEIHRDFSDASSKTQRRIFSFRFFFYFHSHARE